MEEAAANMINTEIITQKTIESGLSYPQYRELIAELLVQGKVTGAKQSPARLEFTQLNIQRMNRLDKTTALQAGLAMKAASLQQKQTWVLLAEGWCGDCAQIVPVIAKVAFAGNGKIDLRIINPADHPEVMNAYTTNGALSVPKMIVLDENQNEIAVWGPRPNMAQQIMLNWKNSENRISWDDFEKELHTWYAKDRTQSIQEELAALASWHSSM
jgi:thiol-disulfide isomerase/thioredoxin